LQYKGDSIADKVEALDACELAVALGGSIVPDARGNYLCHCPAHLDHTPSLAVRDGFGRVLVYCYAGCPQSAVLAALRRLKLLRGAPGPLPKHPCLYGPLDPLLTLSKCGGKLRP
jgi:hypothetical protein